MIYEHGGYTIDCHLADVSADPEFNSLGQLVRRVRRHVIDGVVRGADQAALKTAILAFETAFNSPVTKSGMNHNDGTTDSAHMIDTTGQTTENGIVARYRWTSEPQKAEYVIYRSFQVQIECVFLGAGADQYQYSNRIFRYGGGPLRTVRMTQGGNVGQTVYPQTPYHGYEVGFQKSRAGIVLPKAPTYPSLVQSLESPTAPGRESGPDGITIYTAEWSYSYLSEAAF